MIIFEELELEMEGYKPRIKELKEVLDIEKSTEEISHLQKKSESPEFWNNLEESQKILQKIRTLKIKVV